MEQNEKQQIVYTATARCRDCYRCLRVCPVKAIRLSKGQAYVEKDRCISCGTCIRECPQGAKILRDDTGTLDALLASDARVAVSIAPSFASVYTGWQRKRLASALRQAGFSYIAGTAAGAWHVARRTDREAETRGNMPSICTACPAVVALVEHYMPDMADMLVPVASPMIAHGRMIKHALGPDTKVVFVGPCSAKKAEAERPENAGVIDAVITFIELNDWLAKKGISLAACEESGFDEESTPAAHLFPLPGGLMKTGNIPYDGMSPTVYHVSGIDSVREALESVRASAEKCIIEPLFCAEGCISGPGIKEEKNLFERRKEVIGYSESRAGAAEPPPCPDTALAASFAPSAVTAAVKYTEDDIRRVLEHTDKASPEQRLNCGACGYNSCREKAIAVLEGMAEPEMCLPYMRRLIEQKTDRIIDTSPNGIVVLDEALNIVSMNPAFRKFFMCGDAVIAKHISYLMDPALFERLSAGNEDAVDVTLPHENYGIVCHELLYALREERQYVGIFINVTKTFGDRKKLETIKYQTVVQARQLLEHQIAIAQKIALFLGESTAQGEDLVMKLMSLTGEDDDQKG